ncbi:MAG: hypothetical protein J4N98_06380, partial [Chloroflexi bacterium]|nr:hypothetical protein [Chloroflexota bacterium]
MVTRLSSAAVPLAIAVMITTVVLSACGGDGDDQPVLADVTPQPGRQPTHTPPPTLITSTTTAATLVFIRDDD